MEREKLNALVIKAKAGDPEAMNDLISASYQDIYFYALKLVKKEDLAADATQDSCIEIIQTLGNLKESAAFVTWCRRIVYHQCTKRMGKSRVVPLEENEDGETILDRLPDETPGSMPEEVVEDREFRKLMMDMIDELPEGQRSALLLYYYERLSVKQIAEIQDENENTVKSRLHQGRRAVKKQVEAYEAKTGTKLYSVGILPLLYYLFRAGKAEADVAAAGILPGIQAATAPAIAAAAGTAGAGAAAAAGAGILSSLGAKIAAGVLAVAVVAGATVVGTQSGKQPEKNPSPGGNSPGGQTHIHSYETWAFDEEAHWQICSCEAFSEREAHVYENGECTACRMLKPLPSGNELLTFDCTTLTGHWLNITGDYKDEQVREFYVSGDGSFTIMGKTYYPIGNEVFGTDADGNDIISIYLRDTPYDPAVGVTQQEMHSVCVSVTLEKTGEHFTMGLMILEPETYRLVFHNKFYRESDYFGYEKVALTPENFSTYYDITFRPIEFYYVSHNFSLMAIQYMDVTLREGLGYPSWCQLQGQVKFRYETVAYNVQTNTYTIPDPSAVLSSDDLSVDFFGVKKAVKVTSTNGSGFFPTNGVVEWFGKVSEAYAAETVTGYVFVPKQ